MNLLNNSKHFTQKIQWLLLTEENYLEKVITRSVHQKHLPPLVKKKKRIAEEQGEDENLPVKAEKPQRDIFGATILPQNLSYENTKKLSENRINLKDIPLVDENDAAVELAEEKMKARRIKLEKEPKQKFAQKPEDDSEVVIVESNLAKNIEALKKPITELFRAADPYEDIPGPKIFRSFLNTLKYCTRQLTIVSLFRFVKKNTLSSFRSYGPIVKLPAIFGGKIVLISRPEHISAVLEQDCRYPINSALDSIQRSWLHRRSRTSESVYHISDEWEDIKSSLKTSEIKTFEKYFDGIDEIASKFVRRIKTIKNKQNEVPDNFLFEINKWSLESLCTVIFDKSFGFLDYDSVSWPLKTSQLLYSLTVATKHLCHLETGFQFWRFMNTTSLSALGSACDILENIISEYVGQVQLGLIKKRENEGDVEKGGVSLIEQRLLQDDVSPDVIVSNLLDSLLIGMNTMGIALGFLLYHISQNPRVQSDLWKEVKRILPEKYSRLEYDQLSSMKYLRACLKESLRLKMPLPVLTRVLSKNVILNHYQLPKGTLVLMTPQIEGMKKENFDDPTEFNPERWLDPERSHPFTSLPLRNYFEDSFERQVAEASIWVCAAQIIRHFYIEYQYGEIEATSTAISFPNKPLKFTFIDRKE